MAAKYSYATQILVDQIGQELYGKDAWEHGNDERKFDPIKNSPVALIPCEYHGILAKKGKTGRYPGGNMYPDKSWEGARSRVSGGQRTIEYFGGFNVIKDTLGRCLIPATPNNIARLDSMKTGKRQVIVTEKVLDKTGKPVMPTRTQRVRKFVPVPAEYTRIEGEGISGDLSEIIANEVKKALAAAANPLPADEVIAPVQTAVPAPAGIIDIPDPDAPVAPISNKLGQPAAPASGGDDKATPPAASSPAPKAKPKTVGFSPAAIAAAANEDAVATAAAEAMEF